MLLRWCIFHAWVIKSNLKEGNQKDIWRAVSEFRRKIHISRKLSFCPFIWHLNQEKWARNDKVLFVWSSACISIILLNEFVFTGCLPYQKTKLTKDLTPFRWQSAVDESLHAWLIVNETELSLLSNLLFATTGTQWKRIRLLKLWKCKGYFKQTELCYSSLIFPDWGVIWKGRNSTF